MMQKVYKSGSSLVVVVPSDFISTVGVKTGDRVKVKIDYDNGIIQYHFSGLTQLRLPTLMKEKHAKTG